MKPAPRVQSQASVFRSDETRVTSDHSFPASLNHEDGEAEPLPRALNIILDAAAGNLLRLLVHLEPNGTSLAFLQAGSKALDPPLRKELSNANESPDILLELEKSGRLKWDRLANTLAIPASVRKAVIDDLSTDERDATLIQIIELCIEAFPADANAETLDICRLYGSQVEYALQWCDFIHTRNSAMILSRFGNFLFHDGKHKDSERHFLKGMEILNEIIASDRSHATYFFREDMDAQNLVSIKHYLAEILAHQDRTEEAERIQLELVETCQKRMGTSHPKTLTSMHNLMLTYFKQEKLSRAIELGLEIVEKRKLVLGEGHPHTLMAMSLLASVYSREGRLAEAEELQGAVLKQQLMMSPRKLGTEDLLMTMNNLAVTYARQGKLEEAIQLWGDAIAKSEERSRSEHPSTLIMKHNLAFQGYESAGLTQEAILLAEDVLEKKLRIFEESHSSVINTMQGLAALYWDNGDMVKATEMLRKLFHIHKSALGESHPDTIKAADELRDVYVEQERFEEAAEIGAQPVIYFVYKATGEESVEETVERISNIVACELDT
jgi:tetratricopeptide (TPR) repeat protein